MWTKGSYHAQSSKNGEEMWRGGVDERGCGCGGKWRVVEEWLKRDRVDGKRCREMGGGAWKDEKGWEVMWRDEVDGKGWGGMW